MVNELQLDKEKITKELKSIQNKYPFYTWLEKLPIVMFFLSGVLLLIDFMSFIGGEGGIPWGLAAIVCSIIILFIIKKSKLSLQKKYEMTFKRLMAEPILKNSFETVTYNPEAGFSKSEVAQMKLLYISLKDHFETEDLIEGEHMGVSFKQSDLLLSAYSNDDDDNRNCPKDYEGRDISVDGRLTRFPYKVNIKGIVQIATKMGIKWQHYLGKKRVEMEDINFNQNYDVYADDEHSAFYVLTPQVIDYFNSLRTGSKEKIAATMDGEYLYILRYGTGGVFKANIEEPLDVDKKEKQIYAEIAEIERLIKILHLDKHKA